MCIQNVAKIEKEEVISYKVMIKGYDRSENIIKDLFRCPFYPTHMDEEDFFIKFNKIYEAKNISEWNKSYKHNKIYKNLGFSSCTIKNVRFYKRALFSRFDLGEMCIVKCRISGIIWKGIIPRNYTGEGIEIYNSEFIEFLEIVE